MVDTSEAGLEEYHRGVGAVTGAFAEHSHRVRAIESRLKEHYAGRAPAASVAKSIRLIQEQEKEKLQLVISVENAQRRWLTLRTPLLQTAALQMARQRHHAAHAIDEKEEGKLPEVIQARLLSCCFFAQW
jgi:hypothetical protein